MFRSRVTLEEYLKSIEHEAAAGEDVSLDDIDMFPNLEEEDLATMEEDTCDSRVSMNINSSHITIPDDFKDDREVLIIDDKGNARKVGGRINVNMAYKLVPPEKIMVPLNTLLQPIKKAGSLFNRFLADVAKRPNLCPLNYEDWRLVPQYFRARIIMFVRGKFMLPDGVQVNQKIVKYVGEKVRGFKYSLRRKYVKEGTTKEALYNLENSMRPPAVGDQMWVGLVDYFFSDKFQKWSTNGKQARGKQLHAHTSGSQSFAIKRDIFEKEHQREPGPLEWFMKTHQDKDGSYHEPATKKFVDIAVDIVKKKTGAPEVVFSEATVPAETFAYRKLMGPESSGRVRGVGFGVTSNQLHAKHSGQNGTESSGIVSLLLKEVQSLRQEVAYLKAQRSDNAKSLSQGDDGEDNQMPLTPLDTECIRHPLTPTTTLTTNHGIHTKDVVTSDTSGVVHASRSPNIVNKASQQRSSDIICAGGKENIQLNRQKSNAQGKENVQLNRQKSNAQGKENVQVSEQSTPMRENKITSQCLKKPSIVRSLNFEQREQLDCIQRVRKDPSLPSMPSSLNEGVFGDNCKRVIGSTCNQRVQNSLSATKRKEGDRAEIEKLVDKVIEENPDTVKSFRNPRRREFAHCFLGGMAFLEGKKKVDKDLLSKIIYEKLFATLLKQPAGCNSGVNIF